jgi:hypothetical protein
MSSSPLTAASDVIEVFCQAAGVRQDDPVRHAGQRPPQVSLVEGKVQAVGQHQRVLHSPPRSESGTRSRVMPALPGRRLGSAAAGADGTVDFDSAKFLGGTVLFIGAEFRGSTVGGKFSGGTISFHDATFSKGKVDFILARFFGGAVDFHDAKFSGTTVSFRAANFSSGTVDFSSPGDWRVPPEFPWPTDTRPSCVKLPPKRDQYPV